MNKQSEQAFLAKIRAELDASTANLDTRIVRRLQRARREALDRPATSPTRAPWYAAAAFATVACVLVGLKLWIEQAAVEPVAEEISLLAGTDADVAEDLDFYEWLDRNQGLM